MLIELSISAVKLRTFVCFLLVCPNLDLCFTVMGRSLALIALLIVLNFIADPLI